MVASLMHSVQLSSLKGNSDVLGRNKAHFFASAVTAVFIFASTHSAAQQDIDRLGARNPPQSRIQKKQAPSGSVEKVVSPSAAGETIATPMSGAQQPRPRAVVRELGLRVQTVDGILVLPKVGYYGAPVILNVPGLGFVDMPEEEYARLYGQLSSSDPQEMEDAMASLRRIKAAEEEQIEAAQRRPAVDDSVPDAGRDLSEPMSFASPGRSGRRSQRLY